MRPSAVTNGIFLYVLAIAARAYGIDVHAFCVLSNHYHLLVTDARGRLPEFMQYLDSLVARAVNASLGRWEGFWSSEASYSAVAQDAVEDIVHKTVYVLANPVSAGLVRTGREWPGLWVAPEQLGSATFSVARPAVFFRPHGDMPERAELTLVVPPGFSSASEYQARVAPVLAEVEQRKRRELGSAGFVGARRVLAANPFARPASGEPRRGLRPTIAGSDKRTRIGAITRLVEFLRAYRLARKQWTSGVRDVVFPAGTYLLRVAHGVHCASG